MTQITIYSLAILLFFGCSGKSSPKETVSEYIMSLKKMDFENAQNFVTDETKTTFFDVKSKFQSSPLFQGELIKSETLSESEIKKNYGFEQLIETISEKNAIVQSKDSSNQINLEKIDGSWKIVCRKNIMESILFENRNRENVIDAYKNFQEQCKRRTDLIKTILGSNQSAIITSIKQKLNEIEHIGIDILNASNFGTQQNELTDLLAKYLTKTNGSMDLTMQLEVAENAITLARKGFNQAVLNNNSGFGQKMNYLPANANAKAVQIEF